jgi:hypothetical protein
MFKNLQHQQSSTKREIRVTSPLEGEFKSHPATNTVKHTEDLRRVILEIYGLSDFPQ